MADFKKHFDLHVEPGGWRPADEGEPEARWCRPRRRTADAPRFRSRPIG